jgi:hypothetical protein
LLYSPEMKIIRSEVFWSPPLRQCYFCSKQLWLNSCDNGERNFVLQRENICHLALEHVRPDVRARGRFNQLARDANLPRSLAHGSLKHIADSKPASDLLDIDAGPSDPCTGFEIETESFRDKAQASSDVAKGTSDPRSATQASPSVRRLPARRELAGGTITVPASREARTRRTILAAEGSGREGTAEDPTGPHPRASVPSSVG